MLHSGDFSLLLQGFRSRLTFCSFAKSLTATSSFLLRRQSIRTKEKTTQLPAFSCASQVKMGRAKTRCAQTACPADPFLLANARRG